METIRAQTDGNDRKKQDGKLPGGDTTEIKYYRVAVVSLGLLCALLLVVIVRMGTHLTAERDQQQRNMDLLQLRNTKLTKERDQQQRNIDQLQLRNTNLAKERDQKQTNMDQLEIKKNQLDQENQRLTSENNDLMKKNSILTAEKEKLQNTFRIPHGWRCFGSSFYYISTSLKTWSHSRQHCMDLGGHLVIIDSEEEQKFIYGFGKNIWIGLNDIQSEGTWKWVDDKVLKIAGYWQEGEPNDPTASGDEDCVELLQTSPLRSWNDRGCSAEINYICEKQSE